MNPFQYWFDTNPELGKFVNTYYADNKYLLNDYPNTKDATSKMMNSSSPTDKLLALTVLATIKRYFGDNNA